MFRLQHAELARFADQLVELDLRSIVARPDSARELLAAFMRLLTAHSQVEDEMLYPILLAHSSERVRVEARALRDEFAVIYASVEVFLSVWQRPGALESDAQTFINEVPPLVDTLRARIARENDRLYAYVDAL